MAGEVVEVSRYLKIKYINIPTNNCWLSSCVECFKEQGNYSLNELKELVYQQWLLADLSDIAVQMLPDNCLSAEKFIMQGRYAVQLNYFVNVAVSFHKQLQKIRRPEVMKNLEFDCENTAIAKEKEVSSSNRTLKFEITDGVLTVIGFEDNYISSLQEPLVPGKKVILIGPFECRKGILFLKSCNVQVLGGEVDALHIPNAPENILARALKQPENPDPYHLNHIKEEFFEDPPANNSTEIDDDEEAMMMLAEVIENKVTPTAAASKERNTESRSKFESNIRKTNTTQKPLFSERNINSSTNNFLVPDDIEEDMAEIDEKINFNIQSESIHFDDDFEQLNDPISRPVMSNSNISNIDNSSENMTECQLFDITSSTKKYEEMTELKRKLNESYRTNNLSPSSSTNTSINSNISKKNKSLDYSNKKIIFDYLSEKESPLTKMSCEPEECDVVSNFPSEVDDLCDHLLNSDPFPPKKRPTLVKTLSRVIKVLKKPKLKDDKWCVSAIVAARGTEIQVTFASEVIDKIFSISAAEIVRRRNELISDPAMKQKINETLKNSQVRFSTLSCVMVFNFQDAISDPIIVDIE